MPGGIADTLDRINEESIELPEVEEESLSIHRVPSTEQQNAQNMVELRPATVDTPAQSEVMTQRQDHDTQHEVEDANLMIEVDLGTYALSPEDLV